MSNPVQDLRTQLEAAELSPARKERILALLGTDPMTEEAIAEIEDLMQEQIDEDIAADPELVAELANDPELMAEEAEVAEEIAEVEAELAESMKELEAEGAELDAALAEVDEAVSQMRLEQLKQKMSGN